MLESKVQAKIISKLNAQGWIVVKLIKTNLNGIPDLLCLKDGKAIFIEVKAEKGKLSEIQKYRINQLISNGFKAIVMFENQINNIDSL